MEYAINSTTLFKHLKDVVNTSLGKDCNSLSYAFYVKEDGDNHIPVVDSLSVANSFEKEHKHVIRAIEDILTSAQNWANVDNQPITDLFFKSYRNFKMPIGGGVRKAPFYYMTRDGFTLLVMGFTGERALKWKLKYIAAFNAMEERLKTLLPPSYSIDDPIRRAYAWAEEQKQKRALELENKRTSLLLEEKTQQLNESKEWYSIKRWAYLHKRNWRDYNWRKLKALSCELGYEMKKIFDANYGEVNIYHRDVFGVYERSRL